MATQVTRSLKEINVEVVKLDGSIKSLSGQSKTLDKSLKLDPSSVTLVAAKADNLKKQVDLATKKVTALRQAQAQMRNDVSSGKATDEEYKKLSIEVAKAEAQVKSLGAQIKKTANQRLDKLENSLKSVSRAATVALGAIVAVGVGYAKTGDVISKASARYNISAESFQKNAHIFDKTTGNADGYAQALDNVQKQISAVAKGSTKAINAFSALGISTEELSGLGAAEALELIREKLSLVADEDERVTLANMLLSTSGFDVAQVAGLTAEEITALNEKLAEAGVLTQEEADKAGELNDKMADFENGLKKANAELGLALLPLLEALIEIASILIPVLSWLAGIFTSMPKPMQIIVAILLILLIALPKLVAIIKAVNIVMIATKAIAATNPFILIATAVALLIMLLIALANWLGKIFGKKYTLDADTSSLGFDMAAATGDASSKDMGGYAGNNTTNYYDYSTMNNNVEYEADIDDIADKLSTKIKVGGK